MSFQSGATLSECGRYRYALWRIWRDDLPLLGFVMLNPSTADATIDDPTITRCIRRAENMCYGGIVVVNLFAYRATDPKKLLSVDDPIGPLNNWHIVTQIQRVRTVICAWGTNGTLKGRDVEVRNIFKQNQIPMHVLEFTKKGHPKHPLYVKYTAELQSWH